ncbi:MAG: CoB--CoM heterodisulfide reductase iron-sulfur subunit A family protein [Myxococcales bacterium]|nr:MAG: CoB--CoM heterodisulfide reductase iron-sulfur subunit A family protein [Myxococcales bacterium]
MKHSSVMVVGGGIGGITAACELAEVGYEVILVEKAPSLGGRVARMNKYFPKLCPPWCGLEINYRRIRENKNIRVLTLAQVEKIAGKPGDLDVTVKVEPRYVVPNRDGYDKAIAACEVETSDDFNLGLSKAKAIRYWHDMAFPRLPYVDRTAAADPGVKAAIEASGSDGFDLSQKPETMNFKVGAVVWAAGWRPFDPSPISYLGYGKYADVIANVQMERLASVNGPTGGKLVRPSDGRPAKRVAFVQCAGSRDVNYLPYCSGVCCLASMKQATYVREQYPDAETWMFYIDVRSDRYADFLAKIQADEKIHLVKGKAGQVLQDPETKDMIVMVEDVAKGEMLRLPVDLVVLATGVVPATRDEKIPAEAVAYDEYGFVTSDPKATGVFALGSVRKPADVSTTVQDATGVAIKVIHTILGR